MAWASIDTAPKDGTVIQGWVRISHENDGERSEWCPRMRFFDGEWQHKHSHGWFNMNMLRWEKHTPTHWDKLPDPPGPGEAINDIRTDLEILTT